MLLPVDLRDWVPLGYLVHFLIQAMESIVTTCVQINLRGTGIEQYDPVLGISHWLLKNCCKRALSSREAATWWTPSNANGIPCHGSERRCWPSGVASPKVAMISIRRAFKVKCVKTRD